MSAHFELSGCVNIQIMQYWSETNPDELHLKPLYSQKVQYGVEYQHSY